MKAHILLAALAFLEALSKMKAFLNIAITRGR